MIHLATSKVPPAPSEPSAQQPSAQPQDINLAKAVNTTPASQKLTKDELNEWFGVITGSEPPRKKLVYTELQDKEKAAVAMIAMGSSKEDTAKVLDLEEATVGDILSSKPGLDLLCKIQDGLGLTAEERIGKAVNMAVAKQVALLNSENEKTSAEASRYIIDQAIGKALQRAEIRSTSVNIDATSIHAKYQATQEQLLALREQRSKLLQAKQGGAKTLVAELVN